jgi:hypothetical protein
MAEDILRLVDLKEPIKTGNSAIDEINKNLFRTAQKLPGKEGIGKYIQIFANQPQSIFYVAAVIRAPVDEFAEFRRAYQFSLGMPDPNNPARWADSFVDLAQDEFSIKYREDILRALRTRFDVEIDNERKKQFDQE